MNLWIVRHAIAEDRSDSLPDHERELTKKGVKRFTRHVRALSRIDVRFSELLTSPWTRAVQTAELLAKLAEREPVQIDELASAPSQALLDAISGRGEDVAVVGHEPWLSELVAWLVLGDPNLAPCFPLEKGGVILLAGDPRPSAMTLRASFSPAILRVAGR